MERNLNKFDDKKAERISRERGDLRKNILGKVIEDFTLTIKDFIPNRDRGDSKPSPIKTQRTVSSQRQPNSKFNKINVEKKTSNEIGTKSILSLEKKEVQRVTNGNEYHGDASRKQNAKVTKKEVEKKKTQEAKAKATSSPRGKDVKKSSDKIEEQEAEQLKISFSDLDKKLCDGIKANTAAVVSPIKDTKTSGKLEAQTRTYLDLEGRKILREKYTVKLKNQNANKNCEVKVDNYKGNDRDTKKQTEVETTEKVNTNEPKDAAQTETTKSVKKLKELKEPLAQRKPVIKTIRLNHDNRVYKAVTFIDQKESTPLKIKIPNNFKKDKINESKSFIYKIKALESKVSVQMKAKKKEKGLYLRAKSPLIVTNNPSPQTEVAKWAPSCVNHQTKPYYEAWVNTSLAAISKCSEQEKQNIIRTFKRVLDERPQTPDFTYDQLNDERYAGKITVRR